jgi:hypothetical protein
MDRVRGGGECTDGSRTTCAHRRGVMLFLVPGELLGDVSDGDFAHDCGRMECVCPHCGALYWHLEDTGDGVYTRCCSRGNVSVPLPPIPGAEFQDLFQDSYFLTHIRAINNKFAMASTVFTDDTYTVRDANGCVRKCPFASMRVTGQIRTMISTNISSVHGPAHRSGKHGIAKM